MLRFGLLMWRRALRDAVGWAESSLADSFQWESEAAFELEEWKGSSSKTQHALSTATGSHDFRAL